MIDQSTLSAVYKLISELLIAPQERDEERITLQGLDNAPEEVKEPLRRFLGDPFWNDETEYVQTMELTPPVPLYAGAYMFDEPPTCRGAGASARNGYMIELKYIYGHFGIEPDQMSEMPDFLPIMVEFLWLSLEDGRAPGLRRRFVEQLLLPCLDPMQQRMNEYNTPYELVIQALQAAIQKDIELMGDTPPWQPPDDAAAKRERSRRSGQRLRGIPVVHDPGLAQES